MKDLVIRDARPEDADAIVPLLADLGHRANGPEVAGRLARLLSLGGSDRVLVAESSDRLDAHRFHRRLGYADEGIRFARRAPRDG